MQQSRAREVGLRVAGGAGKRKRVKGASRLGEERWPCWVGAGIGERRPCWGGAGRGRDWGALVLLGRGGAGQGLGREGCGFGEVERSGIQWALQVCAACEISKQRWRQQRVCTPGVGETQIWGPSVERWYLWLGSPWGECTQGRREIGGTVPGSCWLGGLGEEGHPQRRLRRTAK